MAVAIRLPSPTRSTIASCFRWKDVFGALFHVQNDAAVV